MAIIGPITIQTHNAIKTFSNMYNLPYITWSNYIKQTSKVSQSGTKENHLFQLYMEPDLSPLLISIIKYNNWKRLYYIYNHEKGTLNLLSLLRKKDFSTLI